MPQRLKRRWCQMSPAVCGGNWAKGMFSLLISSFLPLSLLLFLLFQHVYPGLLTDGSTDVILNLSHFVHRRDTLQQQLASLCYWEFSQSWDGHFWWIRRLWYHWLHQMLHFHMKCANLVAMLGLWAQSIKQPHRQWPSVPEKKGQNHSTFIILW